MTKVMPIVLARAEPLKGVNLAYNLTSHAIDTIDFD